MDIELIEMRDFISQYHPFDLLPKEVLDNLPSTMQSSYARKGSVVVEPGKSCKFLYIIRTGGVETRSPDGLLLARLGEGEAFGVHAMLNGCKALNQVAALEDSLFYMLPFEDFERLRTEYTQFAYFFAPLGAARLRDVRSGGANTKDSQLDLMSTKAGDMLGRAPVTIGPNATIQEAAELMRNERVSCLLVTENDKLVGIMTDRDLRNRVVANAMDYTLPINEIMTPNPISLDINNYAFDVLLAMSRANIRHLPIKRGDEVAGVITNTNLVQRQTTSAVYLVGDIYKRKDFAGLAEVVSKIPKVLVHLVESGATSHNIGHIITSVSDATTIRLVQLAEEKLGPPPVPYVWCASGSQARHEQTGAGDQDNCLILDDSYDEAKHGEYFKGLAQFVCDGLDACGYIYCPGEIMAITDKWRQPLKTWKRYFSSWIEEPEPKALMHSCIFFDLRPITGETGLFDELITLIQERAQKNSIFRSMMVGNALTHSPPLGFFKNFVLIRGGEHDNQFDLKHTGVVPIVDIARIYALESGISAVNTYERLIAEKEVKALSESGAQDLLDSYEFIAITRLQHQSRQIRRGVKPDNFMAPDDLSHFERNHLKDAFTVVKTIQTSMANSYNV